MPKTRLSMLLLSLSLLAIQTASAQEAKTKAASDRQQEIKRLKAMLKDVDAALKALGPIVRPKLSFERYDIRTLLYRPSDYKAPSLATNGESSGFNSVIGGSPLIFGEQDEPQSGILYGPDQLFEAIIQLTGENQWQSPRRIDIHRGTLLVRNTAAVHARIRQILKTLKQNALRCIQLEVGVYQLPTQVQKSIEAASKGKRILSPKVLKKLDKSVVNKKSKLLKHALLTALNQQRVSLHQGYEHSYVSTFELGSGGISIVCDPLADPVVQVQYSGFSLDMRSTVIERSGQPVVAMELNFMRSRLLKLTSHKTPWGKIDTPKIKLDTVRTAAKVPPGSGLLVFSSKATKSERRAAGFEKSVPQDIVIVVRPRLMSSPQSTSKQSSKK